ncbi:MAG: DUF2157 domain-containing protein [Gilvibacter sp.]
MSSKIQNELRELVQAQVISPEVSLNISNYYEKKSSSSPNRLFAIFGVLGSLLVGLGIILILAHNWDNFSKLTKTVWAFVPLIIGQIAVGYSLFKKKSTAWKEASATFLFFAIGSSIALVSQIYNIPGSMASYLLSWIILAAPLLYLLKSHATAILLLIFSTAYACTVGYANAGEPWWYLAMLGYIAPFYYEQIKSYPNHNMTALYHWLIPLSVVISLGAFIQSSDNFGFVMYVCLFGLLYNIGRLPFFKDRRLRTNGYLLMGSLGTIVTLIFVSFKWIWQEFAFGNVAWPDIVFASVLALAAAALFSYGYKKTKEYDFSLFQVAFVVFAIVYFIGYADMNVAWILTNLLVFSLGLFAVRIGARKNRFSILNYGLLIITVLIACRFFDTNITFVLRGIIFLCIGAGFFAANYLMYRKQQNLKNHE